MKNILLISLIIISSCSNKSESDLLNKENPDGKYGEKISLINYNSINDLLYVMRKLRDPKNGCPWDKKQTLETIIPHSIEEVYEVAEQIYNKNYTKLKEELGDLLFQVVYLAQIADEKNKFNFNNKILLREKT